MKSQKNKKLRVLFVSGELIAGDLAYRLKKEGCDVKLYIEDKSRKDCFDGMIKKTNNWRKELEWVGKNGLIVFDDVGYGKIQDELRKEGYLVVGGSEGGDKLEKDRQFGQRIFKACGIKTIDSHTFDNINSAIDFVKKNKGEWVIKQNSHFSILTYVGVLNSGSDVISVLENYKKYSNIKNITLQKKNNGIEIGVARYFNGNDWVGPIEINVEHKRLFNDDVGPMTGEMGTLMWYDDNENNKLFQKTLNKLKPYLQENNFKGDIDINCIVDKNKIFPIEATARFGCPSTQLQTELHLSLWKEFLMAIAKGEDYKLNYKKGFGVVVLVAVPPFPYKLPKSSDSCLKGTKILFKNKLNKEEFGRVCFDDVSFGKINGRKKEYYVAGEDGFVIYVSGSGKTVQEARKQAYDLINKIVIPKMFYRTDIGLKFIEKDEKLLKKWGWI